MQQFLALHLMMMSGHICSLNFSSSGQELAGSYCQVLQAAHLTALSRFEWS